jgi:integrase
MSEKLKELVERIKGMGKEAGRKHFLSDYEDIETEILKILQRAWIKDESDQQIAKTYNCSYISVYRLRKELEPYREELLKLIEKRLGEKKYFANVYVVNGEIKVETEYENVKMFVNRYLRSTVKPKIVYIKAVIRKGEEVWRFLNKKDPKDWTITDADNFIASLRAKGYSHAYIQGYVIAIRQLAPHLQSQGFTTDWTKSVRTCNLFLEDVKQIIRILNEKGLKKECLVFKLHVTIGSRESSFCSLTWGNIDFDRKTIDVYESKVKGGITWKDISLTWLFGDELVEELKEYYKANNGQWLVKNKNELGQIYQRIKKVCMEDSYFKDNPAKLKEIEQLKPHYARKIHCNVSWELGIPLEILCGQVIGSQGFCKIGVGWSDFNTARKHYLALSSRVESEIIRKASEKAKEILKK